MQAHEGEEDEEILEGEEAEEGIDKVSVSALANSSAAFWQRMLKRRWERLQAEAAEAAAEATARGVDGDGDDASGASMEASVVIAVCCEPVLALLVSAASALRQTEQLRWCSAAFVRCARHARASGGSAKAAELQI